MHLKSISLKGFKSFPDRTTLVFSPGVSVIVGPNGCGKSNITDAVLWALGEQSPLAVRGQSMQDVIFNGGEGQSPRRAAEVEVVIDNSGGEAAAEFSEIAIQRRLDRHGEGEYRLNGARCRLADVVEALSEANLGSQMHSVISQGKVEEIVVSKPRQRRMLIEEAAGLGKHRKRRRRAELKLNRTRDNLDRALDVEREARSHLRPLREQAKAAEIHARLQRQADELAATLLAAELGGHEGELGRAESESEEARERREAVESSLAAVSEERTAIEEQLAERDRERTQLWGRLTALKGGYERLTVRAEAMAARQAELAAAIESHRATLGSLLAEAEAARQAAGEDPVTLELRAARTAIGGAGEALDEAEAAPSDSGRLSSVARMREQAERAARAGRRAEELLGSRRQSSLESTLVAEEALLAAISRAARAAGAARDATGRRVTALEAEVVGAEGGDELTTRLRELSRAEATIQADLRAASERVTVAEVSATQLRDRRDEVASELERIAERLDGELPEPEGPLDDEGRGAIERKLERLARRRERIGPVNPLAESEYEAAEERVAELTAQREDLEAALADLEKLIRETDRTIKSAFEETFEAAKDNFEELIAHLFPGGRGRLRLVDEPRPRPVTSFAGAGEEGERAAEAEAGDEPEGVESGEDDEEDVAGIELEVTPAGKAMRRLSLLSGGEKSLVALAFVFAVFLARPSPFYILDEVEAALDDANIDRFLQLVRRFSDRAQFVIVTHQKRTMDAADVLYGVSMAEGGVTKVISRRLPRAEQEQLAAVSGSSAAEPEAEAA